jgi:hypothetical protein
MMAVPTREMSTGATSTDDASTTDMSDREASAADASDRAVSTAHASSRKTATAAAEVCTTATAAEAGVCTTTATAVPATATTAVGGERADRHQQSGRNGRGESYMTQHGFLLFWLRVRHRTDPQRLHPAAIIITTASCFEDHVGSPRHRERKFGLLRERGLRGACKSHIP